jgi:hypothetical protein
VLRHPSPQGALKNHPLGNRRNAILIHQGCSRATGANSQK